MSEQRAAVLGCAAMFAAFVAGCAKVGSEPTAVVSLGFDTSTVAVAVGDTLRDTLGRVLPLRAAAFNASGDTIADPAVAIGYLVAPSDTGVLRVAGALAIGVRLSDTPARVFASAGGIQSLPKTVEVIRRPTALEKLALVDSARYATGGQSTVSAGGAQARVLADSSGTVVGVRRVVVRFTVERAAPRIADSVAILDERPLTATLIPRSPLDTTDRTGNAGRRVLVYLRAGAAARDTIVLRATIAYPAVYHTPGLARDTVRIVVPVFPQSGTP